MTFVSYAQNFEDVLLWRALRDVENGRYLDIGAQDPVIDSVSLAFYNLGWRGVHVEPIPAYTARLREARPDEAVVEAAVTDLPGPIPFYELGGLSSGREDIAEHHRKCGHKARKILVPTVRLDRLLQDFDAVHWMKIDVEGMEADVLRSWGESDIRPWIVVIEATYPNTQEPTHQLWVDEILRRGYREVFFDGLSRYFLHESQRDREAAFQAPANVFDGFAIRPSHFCAQPIRTEIERTEEQLREEQAMASELRSQMVDAQQRVAEAQRQLVDEQSRTSDLQSELTAAEAALVARQESETAALKKLAETEQEHRASIDRLWNERAAAEQELHRDILKAEREFRRELAERQEALHKTLQESHAREAAVRMELARVEERANTLADKFRQVEEERDRTRREAEEARADFEDKFRQASEERDRTRRAAEQARGDFDRELSERQMALERGEAALVRADALIRAARSELPGRWLRLGNLLGFWRAPPSYQALSSWSLPLPNRPAVISDQLGNISEANLRQGEPQMNPKNPYIRANSLPELLSWNDVDFVRCAYVTVLGRQPDAGGEAYYTDRIRRGHSKMEVLWQLRKSAEGPRHDPGIAGFDRALRRARLVRKHFLGPFLKPFLGGEGDTSAEHAHRMLLNTMKLIRRQAAADSQQISRVAAALDRIESRLEGIWTGQTIRPAFSSAPLRVRSMLDPIDLATASTADDVVEAIARAVNASHEATRFA